MRNELKNHSPWIVRVAQRALMLLLRTKPGSAQVGKVEIVDGSRRETVGQVVDKDDNSHSLTEVLGTNDTIKMMAIGFLKWDSRGKKYTRE